MRNITKMFLSSAILATGTMAADVMDVQQDMINNGEINIYPDMTIKVKEGKWIINKGTINFMKPLEGEAKFKILGSNTGTPSGIKNKGPGFGTIDGEPTTEDAKIGDAMYFNLSSGGGTIQVKDPNTSETRELKEEDYDNDEDGTIQMEKGGLYNFLREDDHIGENNVIVLRGKQDVSNNMILLNHNDAESAEDKTSEGAGVLEITNPFVNSEGYKSFKKDENDPVEYDKSYALGVNGFFKFTGTNTNFNQGKVEFMDGSSEFTSANSIFGTNDLTISGGTVNINISDVDPVVLSGRTINVTSHKNAEENDVYGCLVVTAGNVVLDENSVLNLGYKAE